MTGTIKSFSDIELTSRSPPQSSGQYHDDDEVVHGSSSSTDRHYDDDMTLRRLGKRPLLPRSFGFMSILGFSCSSLCSWESALLSTVPALLIAGPAGLVWALVFAWAGVASVYGVLAELSSIAPISGGQYHWAYMLAPRSCSNFLSYLTAWLSAFAWQAMAVAVNYLVATLIQGIVVLAHPTYIPLAWHTMLLIWAFGIFCTLLNVLNSRTLAKLEGLILVLHLAGFFGVLIPMVYFAPHNSADFVFTTFMNLGAWPTQTLAWFVCFPTVGACLMGADCAAHMAEEVENAAVVVPRALMYTILINGALALAMIIAMIFSLQDVDAAMAAVNTMFYPALEIFLASTRSVAGACIMAAVILVLAVAGTIGVYASTSRLLWSFARDQGLPCSNWLTRLTAASLPINALLTTLGITVLLSLIVLGSSVALDALLSLSTAALFSSYLMSCALLLWNRYTGRITPYVPGVEAVPGVDTLTWGPWRIPEPFGTVNNVFAVIYCVLTLFWSFWPQTTAPTAATMNWSVLVYGVVVIFCVAWYGVRARKTFKGPLKEL